MTRAKELRSRRIEMVRSFVDAINAGDWNSWLSFAGPDFEYDLSRTISPLRGVHSLKDMPRVTEEFLGPWESVRYEAEEITAHGDNVVVPFTTHFRGRDGIELATQATWVWAFRGLEVRRVTLYQDRGEAFADAAGHERLAGLRARLRRGS